MTIAESLTRKRNRKLATCKNNAYYIIVYNYNLKIMEIELVYNNRLRMIAEIKKDGTDFLLLHTRS